MLFVRSRLLAATGGTLPAGERAAPGTVGFLGEESDLTPLNAGDPLGDLATDAEWVGSELRVNTPNFTLSGYKLTTTVFATGAVGANFTVENCVIDDQGNHIFGVYATAGSVTVRDTTIRGLAEGDGSAGITAASNLVFAYRCDVSGFEDAVACTSPSEVDQCYCHDLDDGGVDPHNDVIQHFPGGPGGLRVTNCYLTCSEAAGKNACLTFDDDPDCVADNNFMQGGGFFFRIENATGVIFTNNDFGPLTGGEFGLVARTGGSVATWTNNRDSSGDLVPAP